MKLRWASLAVVAAIARLALEAIQAAEIRSEYRIAYGIYLGGSGEEFVEHHPWLGPDGTVLLTSSVGSADFPTTDDALSRALRDKTDGFLTRLSQDGTEYWLMPAPNAQGHIYVVGGTNLRDFPVTPDAMQPRFDGGVHFEAGACAGTAAMTRKCRARQVCRLMH